MTKDERLCLCFQNHAGDGLFFRMRDRQGNVLRAHFRSELSGFAMELNCWAPTWFANHLHVAPAHTMVPTGTERFHCSFFGGESRSITLHPIRLRLAVLDFPVREDA